MNEQRDLIKHHLIERGELVRGRNRPPQPARDVFNRVLWVSRTGAAGKDLPDKYPPYQTYHRRFQQQNVDTILAKFLRELADHLIEVGKIVLSECAIDGTFASTKKVFNVGKTKRGKGTKVVANTDRKGLPGLIRIERYSPAEVT